MASRSRSSSVFLHYVFDLWFEQDVKPRMRGRAFLVRYADDFVIGFSDKHDAQRVMEVVPKRFGRFGLTAHPTKTKLVPFRPPPSRPHDGNGPRANRRGTFDLLGFSHYWGRSRRGFWVVKLKTASDRFSRSLQSIDEWCRTHRHRSLREQQQKLNEKLRGHYARTTVSPATRDPCLAISGRSSVSGGSGFPAATAAR